MGWRELAVLAAGGCLSPACYAHTPATGVAQSSVTARLTVVPPGPVTDQIAVEARLAVRNAAPGHALLRAKLYWDRISEATIAARETVRVGPGEARLVRAWCPTKGRSGQHRLLFVLEEAGHTLCEGSWPLTVVPATTPGLPMLQGAWLDLLGLSDSVYARNREVTEQDVRDMVDAMGRLGMGIVIITYVEYQGWVFFPAGPDLGDGDAPWQVRGRMFAFDPVATVLSEAQRRGMHVFLGLGRAEDIDLLWDGLHDHRRLATAIETSAAVARELWRLYGHYQSLYGWYLTHEANDLAAAAAYYDPVADACHALAPEKPVMVAPAGTPVADTQVLQRSHVDIFCYQDAVGAGYVPGAYSYDPERRLADLEEVFSRYSTWHAATDKHFWADLEVWQMSGPTYACPYPASFSRVARQIGIEAKFAETLTAYEFSGFIQTPDADLQLIDPRAKSLCTEYEDYLRGINREDAPR